MKNNENKYGAVEGIETRFIQYSYVNSFFNDKARY